LWRALGSLPKTVYSCPTAERTYLDRAIQEIDVEVIIDGVRYVPVTEANPNMEAIAAGLISSFWGEVGRGDDLAEKMEGLTVRVYDDGDGDSLESVLADIARELAKG
jgi:hypothetical protein